eukprot:4459444-Prymnesium_polylepis.1
MSPHVTGTAPVERDREADCGQNQQHEKGENILEDLTDHVHQRPEAAEAAEVTDQPLEEREDHERLEREIEADRT